MKKLLLVFVFILISSSIKAQDNKELVLNEETNLIEAKIYHDNGVLAQTGSYTTEGLLQGEWISYNAEGVKTAVAHYNEGKKEGTWLFYAGDLLKEVTFENSKILSVNTWNRDTRVVSN